MKDSDLHIELTAWAMLEQFSDGIPASIRNYLQIFDLCLIEQKNKNKLQPDIDLINRRVYIKTQGQPCDSELEAGRILGHLVLHLNDNKNLRPFYHIHKDFTKQEQTEAILFSICLLLPSGKLLTDWSLVQNDFTKLSDKYQGINQELLLDRLSSVLDKKLDIEI